MRITFALGLWALGLVVGASAATTPHYINRGPVTGGNPPQIDATSFENRNQFIVTTADTIPYETFNTLNFTNTSTGVMNGAPGFIFDHSYQGGRSPMANWVNKGLVVGSVWVDVKSTNITSSGQGTAADLKGVIATGARGVIHLEGQNANLSRSGLYSGQRFGSTLDTFGFFGTNIFIGGVPDVTAFLEGSLLDNYWFTGSNTYSLPALSTSLTPPSIRTPNFQVITSPSGLGGGSRSLPSASFNNGTFIPANTNFTTFTFTNRVDNTNIIQVVFVPVGGNVQGLQADVRFVDNTDFGGQSVGLGNVAIVRFSAPDFDPVNQVAFTNYLYLEDYLAFQTTNFFYVPNLASGTRLDTTTKRPNTYYLSRSQSGFVSFDFGNTNNATFDPAMIYNPDYQSNRVAAHYTAYSASLVLGENTYGNRNFVRTLGSRAFTGLGGFFGAIYVPEYNGLPIDDSSNFFGRVEIDAKKLNLDQVRIHAESALSIKTDDLVGNKLPTIDSPLIKYDLRSKQSDLVVSNLVPATANRLLGDISAWSAIWQNSSTNGGQTNVYLVHVLVVDHSLSLTQAVVLQDIKLRGTNVTIADTLRLSRNFLVEANNLTITETGNFLNGSGADIAASNLVGLVNFTNRGVFASARDLQMGFPPAKPLSNIVNYGTLDAESVVLHADRIINSNLIASLSSSVELSARDVRLYGTNTIAAVGNILISANDFFATNSNLRPGFGSGGTLILDITNSVADAGVNSSNIWIVNDGFSITRAPKTGDLLGTVIYSVAGPGQEVVHYSGAKDNGVSPDGYVNNMAIGHLVLDGGSNSLFRFSPPDGKTGCALYVDYLELLNFATNYNDSIVIDPGLTLYVANGNISPRSKLNHLSEDRLRWVSTYAGPLSSTNVVYPSTTSYPLNINLVGSSDLDSDNDGIANINDPTPVWVSEDVAVSITTTNISPARRNVPVVSWNALMSYNDGAHISYVTNIVDWVPSLSGNYTWKVLTNFTSPVRTLTTPQSIPAVFYDLTGTNQNRMYRVRVQVEDP